MVGLRSQEGQGKEATGGLKTHSGVCNKLPNFSVPPERESICGHHIYTLLHWWVVITVTSLSWGAEISSGKPQLFTEEGG